MIEIAAGLVAWVLVALVAGVAIGTVIDRLG